MDGVEGNEVKYILFLLNVGEKPFIAINSL